MKFRNSPYIRWAKKASKYCENNAGYSVVLTRGEKPLLVHDITGDVKTVQMTW